MKYFAMIDGHREGPFELWQLPEAGVRPETFVWCKGMSDWDRARNVADVCRYYRQRLAGTAVSSPQETGTASVPAAQSEADMERRTMASFRFLPPNDPEPELDRQPVSMLVPAIICTLACFPVTGFMAIYYSILTRRAWSAATHTPDSSESNSLRRQAHDASRNAKMWTGITFFLGLIFWAFMAHFS